MLCVSLLGLLPASSGPFPGSALIPSPSLKLERRGRPMGPAPYFVTQQLISLAVKLITCKPGCFQTRSSRVRDSPGPCQYTWVYMALCCSWISVKKGQEIDPGMEGTAWEACLTLSQTVKPKHHQLFNGRLCRL